MTLHIWKLMAGVSLCALALDAQTANPLVNDAKQAYTSIKNNLEKAAEKMPPDAYDFKPTPDIRSFGQLMAHIADSQMRACSAASGETKQANAASKTSKDDLVAAMKASIAECDSAFSALNDSNANQMMKFRNGERSRLGILMGMLIHDNEEYGYAAVYMRLKGVVPPSSEGR